MLASRSKVIAFVAIAFYFLIARTATSRFHKLLMLQHLKRLRRERKIKYQTCVSMAARRFRGRLVEGKFRILRRTFEYIVWVVGPYLSKRDTKLDRSLSRKSCKWYLEWKIQSLLLPDGLPLKKVDPIVPFMIERNALSKTCQWHDLLTAGSEILPRYKRIYLSFRPWLPAVTMPDHRVITTFTLVKFLLSSTNLPKYYVYTRKCLPW